MLCCCDAATRYRQGLAAAVVESGVQAVRSERRVSEAEAARVVGRVHAALDVIAVGTTELLRADLRKVVKDWGHTPAPAVLEQLRRDLGAVLQPQAPPAATGTVDGPGSIDYDGWSAAASTAVRCVSVCVCVCLCVCVCVCVVRVCVCV